ncbi:MAG: hypothetical protein [Olavius algarvensis Gamma 1 endosymbiont]|nr:MAG: hypothetical protein [Olavius algarvensis Gamma 1 endosymbiont]
MDEDLKHILTTVLGVIVFMFLALSTITILSSGRVFDDTAGVAEESARESAVRALPPGGRSKGALSEGTLAAVTERP